MIPQTLLWFQIRRLHITLDDMFGCSYVCRLHITLDDMFGRSYVCRLHITLDDMFGCSYVCRLHITLDDMFGCSYVCLCKWYVLWIQPYISKAVIYFTRMFIYLPMSSHFNFNEHNINVTETNVKFLLFASCIDLKETWHQHTIHLRLRWHWAVFIMYV